MERVEGIEPSCAAWKAAVLPLNYTRFGCTAYTRPLPLALLYKSAMLGPTPESGFAKVAPQ